MKQMGWLDLGRPWKIEGNRQDVIIVTVRNREIADGTSMESRDQVGRSLNLIDREKEREK